VRRQQALADVEPLAHQPLPGTGILPPRDAGIDIFRLLPAIAAILTCGVVLLPFVVAPALPLFDLPNHLARLHVLGAAADSPIRRVYAPHWALMPNLGIDLIYMACHFVASPEIAVRLCLIGSLLALFAAIWRIQWRLWGGTSYAVALAPVFVTGLCVFMGYLNYILSVAVIFAALALYLGWRERLSSARVAALSILATMAWFCHIAGFAMFGFLLAMIDVTGRRLDHPAAAWRDRARQGARTAGVLLTVLGPGAVLSLAAEKQAGGSHVVYGGTEKLRLLIAPVFLTGAGADLFMLGLALCVIGLALFGRALTLAPIVRPAVIVLALLIVVCPFQIGQGIDVDTRMVLPLAALLLAGGRLELPRRRGVLALCLSSFLAVLLLRDQAFLRSAREDAHEIAAFRRLVATLPAGSAMLAVDATGPDVCTPTHDVQPPPLDHLISFAVIDRGIYTPSIFTSAGMQPLQAIHPPFPARTKVMLPPSVRMLQAVTAAGGIDKLRAASRHDPKLDEELGHLRDSEDMPLAHHWPDDYQSLLVMHDGCGRNPLPHRLDFIGSGDFFSVFRVRALAAGAAMSF